MTARWLISAVAALMLVATACGSDDDDEGSDSAPGHVVVEVSVTDGDVETSDEEVDAEVGDLVHISVTTDAEDEVHVHGYDVSEDVAPGTPAQIDFTADTPGQFEVELEDAGLLLFELRVE